MHRTQIYINDEDWNYLKELAAKSEKSVSDLIRAAIKKVYFGPKKLDFIKALDNVSGIWANYDIEPNTYLRNLRKGNRLNLYESDT